MVTKPFTTSCTIEDELLYTLVKLRLGLVNKDIAYRANIDKGLFSKIFHRWLNILYRELKQLIIWPDSETLRKNLLKCFNEKYSRVVCIIDCFEVFIQRPRSFDARAATYSNNEKHTTIKVLIGILPTGAISFISKAWGGRALDKIITQQSGFLTKINYGDVIMADRGFNVFDDIATIGAHLVNPAFTKGKKQLSGMEVETSGQMS
ncbi:PREDICTED: uncharacterized protein LOC100641785 [Amphimedon queenslandica]|uniref:DDE Tnp4 domain-containing protein n=1 Tax=Amphimedon queenslandica TaxID=400682 RepID=A0A1X7SWI4_AMPQE|nr:PREDICTED: uncharacterized protein LOC100641785 [Amphimedon queenslandica]|eukprot:XP_011408684.1 PREDICTED: uncharacterized protein LOC100641785 [Amphimedon queenslandica]